MYILMSYHSLVCLTLLQVAHHYPTIHHLTQTHPHAWLPKRVGTHFFQFSTLYPHFYPFGNNWVDGTVSYQGSKVRLSVERSKDKEKSRKQKHSVCQLQMSRYTQSTHTHLRIRRTHTDPKQSLTATDKALHRCTFCVFRNNMSQAAAADRAIQSRYLNAVTT